ncbi:MAG: 5-formyltetrahydrofolate cyclo-ligase [Candidatus Peribacteraceae bacterium]|nr:5-formyltetrahydrofolate cyclo-ligase [Candidatus Peribacteraceae bacterium]MBP9850544.1 5-formyltetrahydrofolate cyclo-ligase [Candidatus Peribacteraceae bacterium]
MEAKAELRRAMKERLSQMTENDRRVEGQIIVRELAKRMPETPSVIAAFSPYLDEPDIRPLLTKLLEQKNVICMGKIEAKRMIMHRVRSFDDIGRNPVSNILEPTVNDPVDESKIALAIIPGRAFTRQGQRMGRGNGGYDRWLAEQSTKNPMMKTIGVCFDCQLLPELPIEPHDRLVDAVLTSTVYAERNRPHN